MKEDGFTLIELLVVVAIIGIISSVALASLATARSNARDVVIKNQVRAIGQLMELDQVENQTYGTLARGWAGIDNGSSIRDCAYRFSGTNELRVQARAICEVIVASCSECSDDRLYSAVRYNATQGHDPTGSPPSFDRTRFFSIMARLNNGNFFCYGSSGRVYEGPINPGTGSWTGTGCIYNP